MRGWGRPILGGVAVTCLVALAFAFGFLPGGSTLPAVHVAPVLKVKQDRWRVDASLPGVTRFTFVVRVAGSPDVYANDVPSPFTINPLTFGGRSVSVSARAGGRTTNPWSTPVKVDVPPAQPVLTIASDHWHVDAYLPGTKTFMFAVKAAGLPDTYVSDVSPPFVIDREKFGGRSVSVSARANGPQTHPWAPEVKIDVPQVKLFGMVDAPGPQGTSGADAKKLGITLDRIEFTFGQDFASMDDEIARDTGQGLTPLVLLNQTSTTIPGMVLPISRFDLAEWKNWASGAVARYGPGGTFWRGRKDGRYAPTHFEVLNEPYGSWFFTPPEPAAYARFFVEVVSAAKAANPRAKFLLAGSPYTFLMSGTTYSSQTWDSLLKGSPDGTAAQRLADGVTVHPYGSLTADRGWHGAVGVHNDFPQLPVWITEIGYRLGEVIDGVTVNVDTQAALLQRSLVDFMSWPWAQAYVWFKWFDYEDQKTGEHNWYGVVEPDGSHRPAYDTYRRFIMSHASQE
jgi:hypothetical protein